MCLKKMLDEMQNNVDPDQMLQNAAFDLGLHDLHKPVCLNT